MIRPDEFITICVHAAGVGFINELDMSISLKDGSATVIPFELAGYEGKITPGSVGEVHIIEVTLQMEQLIKATVELTPGRRDWVWVTEPNRTEAMKLILYL